MRYNKTIQKCFGIDINTYINYNQQIELEIIPFSMRRRKKKKFINFSNAEDESHCHIYFNDNSTEIKRNYLVKKDKVSKIKIILDAKFNSFNKLFFGCRIIKEINFIKFNRKDIKDMSYMFFNCKKLKKLNIY